MVKMDLKDAYLQIPIHSNHLQFIWEEKHYKFQCLPFGLSSAPRIFTKLLKPVVGFLRQIGLHLIVYLDDMLFMHVNKDQLAVACQQGPVSGDGISDLQLIQGPGVDGKYQEVHLKSNL